MFTYLVTVAVRIRLITDFAFIRVVCHGSIKLYQDTAASLYKSSMSKRIYGLAAAMALDF